MQGVNGPSAGVDASPAPLPLEFGGFWRPSQQNVPDAFDRGFELYSFAGPVVQLRGDTVEVFLAEPGEDGALRKVLAHCTVQRPYGRQGLIPREGGPLTIPPGERTALER